jgi:hydroxymethylbilane synthase
MRLRIGTRGSKLAFVQASEVVRLVETLGVAAEIVVVKTKGDIYSERPIAELGTGVFVKEIERALLDGRIDLAVHSSKDMPSSLTIGLVVAAYPVRQAPSDCLVTADGRKLDDLPGGRKWGQRAPGGRLNSVT